MFGRTKTVTCVTEDELDNLLRAHYVTLRQGGLASAVRNSYKVEAVLSRIMSDDPSIGYYKVTMPLFEWRALEAAAKSKDALKQIVSGEYFEQA